MKDDKSIFLKVDCVEPVFKTHFSPDERLRIDGIKVWIGSEGHLFPCDKYTICGPDVALENGRRQVVALVKELGEMKFTDKNELFRYSTVPDILSHFSYDEVVEKLDAWKKEKEIRVRDEVCYKAFNERFVITKIYTPCDGDTIVNGLKKDGTAIKGLLLCNVEKTGVHVDNIDSYLEV